MHVTRHHMQCGRRAETIVERRGSPQCHTEFTAWFSGLASAKGLIDDTNCQRDVVSLLTCAYWRIIVRVQYLQSLVLQECSAFFIFIILVME